jgi:hypothetical protein
MILNLLDNRISVNVLAVDLPDPDPHCYNHGEPCGEVARVKKGDANCVCLGGTFTGVACYDTHTELNQGAVTRYPVSHPGKTYCRPGEMLVNIGGSLICLHKYTC